MHWILRYSLVADYVERREELRGEHLALVRAAQGRGNLMLAGPLDPPNEAYLIFRGDRAAVDDFVASDPYVINGLVEQHRVLAWNVTVGG